MELKCFYYFTVWKTLNFTLQLKGDFRGRSKFIWTTIWFCTPLTQLHWSLLVWDVTTIAGVGDLPPSDVTSARFAPPGAQCYLGRCKFCLGSLILGHDVNKQLCRSDTLHVRFFLINKVVTFIFLLVAGTGKLPETFWTSENRIFISFCAPQVWKFLRTFFRDIEYINYTQLNQHLIKYLKMSVFLGTIYLVC